MKIIIFDNWWNNSLIEVHNIRQFLVFDLNSKFTPNPIFNKDNGDLTYDILSSCQYYDMKVDNNARKHQIWSLFADSNNIK